MEKATGDRVDEMAVEKGQAPTTRVDPSASVDMKDGRILEASEIYGDIETAEKYGYVSRGYVYASGVRIERVH